MLLYCNVQASSLTKRREIGPISLYLLIWVGDLINLWRGNYINKKELEKPILNSTSTVGEIKFWENNTKKFNVFLASFHLVFPYVDSWDLDWTALTWLRLWRYFTTLSRTIARHFYRFVWTYTKLDRFRLRIKSYWLCDIYTHHVNALLVMIPHECIVGKWLIFSTFYA